MGYLYAKYHWGSIKHRGTLLCDALVLPPHHVYSIMEELSIDG